MDNRPASNDALSFAHEEAGFELEHVKGLAGGLYNRLAFRYAIYDDLRFISHQDTLRLFRRAFARADLPLRHSEGFNPHPKLSIVLPRPVGVASDVEMLIADLRDEHVPDDAITRLTATVPAGLRFDSAVGLRAGERMRLSWAEYDVTVATERKPQIAEKVDAFMACDRFEIRRPSKKRGVKTLDLRGFIASTEWNLATPESAQLRWRQEVSIDGTARIGEVLEAFGLSPRDDLHRVTRRSVDYHT